MNKQGRHPLWGQISYDLKHGIGLKKRDFLLPIVLSTFICIGYYHTFQWENETLGINSVPTVFDYLYSCFEGMPIFRSEYRESFFPSAEWLVFYFWLVYINGKYPKTYLKEIGGQVLVRTDKIQYWWLAKCFWTVMHTLVYYFCVYAVVGVSTLLTGSWKLELNTAYHTKIFPNELKCFSASEFLLISVVLPIMVTIALCLMQTTLSMLTNAVTGILGCIVLLIISAYSCKWYWIGNYLMILRSDRFTTDGVPYSVGMMIAFILVIVCMVGGYVILKDKDFIYRKGEL